MRRESILIYLDDETPEEPIRDILERGVLVGEIRKGGLAYAIETAHEWRVVPSFLVLDIGSIEDVGEALGRLADASPDGDTKLILLGPRDDVKTYRDLRQLGAAEYLPYPVTADDIFTAVVELAQETATATIDPNKAVAFVGVRGGAGASLMAAAAAKACATMHGRRTLLLDLDVAQGIQHVLFDQQQSTGLQDMLVNPERVDSLMLERTVTSVEKNLYMLSMADISVQQTFRSEAVQEIIKQSQRGMEMIVMDIPARPQVEQEVLFSAGTLFLCVTPTLVSLRDALSIYQFLDAKSYSGRLVVVLNRVGESRTGGIRRDEFERRLKSRVIEIPFDPRTPGQSITENKNILEIKGPMTTALRKLIEELPSHVPTTQTFWSKLLKS